MYARMLIYITETYVVRISKSLTMCLLIVKAPGYTMGRKNHRWISLSSFRPKQRTELQCEKFAQVSPSQVPGFFLLVVDLYLMEQVEHFCLRFPYYHLKGGVMKDVNPLNRYSPPRTMATCILVSGSVQNCAPLPQQKNIII